MGEITSRTGAFLFVQYLIICHKIEIVKAKLIFIHGMFQNAASWNNWVNYFSDKNYQCIAESWPLHKGTPLKLRNSPPKRLGDLRLREVIDKYADLIRSQHDDGQLILIGHSVGGLIVQSLLNKGMGSAGVCITSAAPNKMLAFDWVFFRNNISIANPFKGDEPFMMTEECFHENFCNTMSRVESDEAYRRTATHDSRNILRDCMLDSGHIDFEKTHKPLLFIAAEKDQLTPPQLNKKNAEAYPNGHAAYVEFANRGHFICNEPGWPVVADFIFSWIERIDVEARR
jgi:pimeloyl-ACP methyl ester carboxylesterase